MTNYSNTANFILLLAIWLMLLLIELDISSYRNQKQKLVIEHVYKYELIGQPVEKVDTIIVYRDTTIRNEWISNIPAED